MAGEPFTFNVVPKTIGDDPQDLENWIYAVAIELEKTVETDVTASNGVILVGTDIQHEDTSSIENVDTSGAQVVDTITFDTFGHVLSFTTRDLTVSDIEAEPADATILKDVDIGISVQEWDDDLDTYAGTPLTVDELSQLQQIGSTTITGVQWVFLGDFDQALITTSDTVFNTTRLESLRLTDAITAPATIAGVAQIYVDSADGDLKVKFGDGFVAVIAADS